MAVDTDRIRFDGQALQTWRALEREIREKAFERLRVRLQMEHREVITEEDVRVSLAQVLHALELEDDPVKQDLPR